VTLTFRAAAAAESKNFNQRLAQVEASGNLPGNTFEIKKVTFNILHGLAARADQMVMGFQVSIHTQCGGVRRDLSQEAALNEETEIVVYGRQRYRWNSFADRFIDLLGRVMSVGGDHGLIHNLPLVRDSETALPRKIAELLMGELH
jgi:hypothetical protein